MENVNGQILKTDNQLKRRKLKTWGFYFSVALLPLTQFIIFYICVNFNSILLALKTYEVQGTKLVVTEFGFQNFARVLADLGSPSGALMPALKNSLVAFLFNVIVGMSCGLVFSYYIFKKMPASNFFKVVLFLPSIISSIIMTMIYTAFVDAALPTIINQVFGTKMQGLISTQETRFGAIIFYNLWVGFGTQILMYVGAMNDIPDGALEACKIDGANALQEFIHVVFPGIYSTFIVFITVNIAQIFTNQMSLFPFFGTGGQGMQVTTIGYLLYAGVQKANGAINQYPYYAAIGILCTLIALPVTMGVRWALNKFGPSVD